MTDEFADSKVMYGTSSGSYPETVSDPLFVKEHTIVLPDILLDTPYYYKVRCTDLSANTGTSAEQEFTLTLEKYIFLPLLQK